MFSRPSQLGTSMLGTSQPQQSSSLFGAAQPQPATDLFGNPTSNQSQTSGNLGISFAQSTMQPQQQSSSIFGQSAPTGNVNNALARPTPFSNTLGAFGQTQQNPPPSQSVQRRQPHAQTLRFGTSEQQNPNAQNISPIWHEGRGMSVSRPLTEQMRIVKDRWNPNDKSSPLRAYLYNHVENVEDARLYQPPDDEDVDKWEEAINKRPNETYVPALAKGFWELGKRAQLQRQNIANCNIRLRDINASLDAQLEQHAQEFGPRLAECRRRHVVARQRTLALAAKIQVLRNKGYVMDNAEEELRSKLLKLEKDVLDPGMSGREQEIWARMIGIRERGRHLKAEMEKVTPVAKDDEPVLDDEIIQSAKKALEAYEIQLRHLQKELQLVQKEYGEYEKLSPDGPISMSTRR